MGSDTEFAARARELIGGNQPIAAAYVTGDAQATVTDGAPLDADFEIGSITKGITGLLYVDALERGEISGESTLGDWLPLQDVPAGDVTLKSITIHQSGLPSMPMSAEPFRRAVRFWRHGTNPYGESVEDVIAQARSVDVGKPKPRYSNFGFELLGHALAAAAHTTYPELVHERIAVPLDLDIFYTPTNADEVRRTALVGTSRRGREREHWTGPGIAPAGGIRASIGAMARLTQALLDRSAPGVTALDPVADFAQFRIGAAWTTTDRDGRAITWHNGGTGGFRSWIGIDRDADTGVVVLSARSASVDRHGLKLLEELAREQTV